MNLHSFGCSFILGSDLADQREDFPSFNTWPALVAKNLGHNYHCHAFAGIGNLRILEQILYHAQDPRDKIFVISWTWIDRFDYVSQYQGIYQGMSRQGWHTIVPNDHSDLSQNYYKNLHSQYRDKLTTLIYVDLTIKTLTQQQIPFVMTYLDPLLIEQDTKVMPVLQGLENQIRPWLFDFDGQGFYDWSRSQGFEISAAWHPLESAHRAASGYVLDRWQDLIKT